MDCSASSLLSPMLNRLNGYGNNGNDTPIRGEDIADRVTNDDFLSYLPNSSNPAIIEPPGKRQHITHNELHRFLTQDFDLVQFGIGHGCRVGVILPNGPELAVCIVGTISRWCAAPINSTNTFNEVKSELQSTKARAIIVLANNEDSIMAATELSLGIIVLNPSLEKSGLFTLTLLMPPPVDALTIGHSYIPPQPGFLSYHHPEIVLLLHTSGTSGNKKCVPYSLDMLLVGVGCIIASWNLRSKSILRIFIFNYAFFNAILK